MIKPIDPVQLASSLENKKDKFLELQGEVKIKTIKFLQINYPKAIFLTLFLIITVVGLIPLRLVKWFRAKVFYSQVEPSQATHVYVQAGQDTSDIETIINQNEQKFIEFKKLKYMVLNSSAIPLGFDYQENFEQYFNSKHFKQGLSEERQMENRQIFGKNEHKVDIPGYFDYMLNALIGPFYILQYIVCVAFFVERLITFSIVLLGFTFISTTVNYIFLYYSYWKIAKVAEKLTLVRVKKDDGFIEVDSCQLVPGDIIEPSEEMTCDCLLVEGDVFVNEANLTGESVPIGKFPILSQKQTQNENRWLYEGSKVLEKKGQALAIVVYTGFTTKRGRILRKILNKTQTNPQFFFKALIFLFECFAVSAIVYFAHLPLILSKDIVPLFVGFRFIDFIGWTFPPAIPIFFSSNYSWSMLRLLLKGVMGTQPKKTVTAARLATMFFDKTGTLTQNQIQIHKIYSLAGQEIEEAKENDSLILKGFGSCHSVREIEGQLMGDQVDLRMFLHSGYKLESSQNSDVKFRVKSQQNALQILRLNQFQSKFQCMSVLVRDTSTDKIYNFIKGAPQKLYASSINKIKGFNEKITELSLKGYRTIALGYKELKKQEVNLYLSGDRSIYEANITSIGLIAFENQLKSDAKQTIQKMKEANIVPKVITGDNIYIAIETGIRSGILNQNEPIVLLRGKNQKQPKDTFKGSILDLQSSTEQQTTISSFQNYQLIADNEFLLMIRDELWLIDRIKIFARITPENKALIVAKTKQKFINQHHGSIFCGPDRDKVGMCGDGANDLIALKQADVGIGINNSDASYGATFTISNLLDVDLIVREGKCTTQNVIEVFRFLTSGSYIRVVAAVLLITDTSYLSSNQLLFINFPSLVAISIVKGIAPPKEEPTPYKPDTNFMGIINQLRFWGNVILYSGAIIAGYLYYVNSGYFVVNPKPIATEEDGFFSINQSNTVIFLMLLIIQVFLAYSLYNSAPWKVPIYRNVLEFLLIVLNLAAGVAFFYLTEQLGGSFQTVPIDYGPVSVILGMVLGAGLLGVLYNWLIDRYELRSE